MGREIEKVVIAKVKTTKDVNIEELELPMVNKYLEDGYKVIKIEQSSPSQSVEDVVITFVLENKYPPR